MRVTRLVMWIISATVIVLGTNIVFGQNYPNKPIRIIAPSLGANGDFIARLIGQGISGSLGQNVIVENRAAGNLRGEIVAGAPPDGYTLLTGGNSLWIGPLLEPATYDPARDFAPVTLTDRAPSIVVVHPAVPVKSVAELIALAKAKPGALNYASSSAGSAPHLAAELFKSMAHVNIVRVPYKAFGVGINDLIAGEVQLVIPGPVPVVPHIKSGRLRALAITTAQPSVLFPGLPTVAASGLPGYEFSQIGGIFAPAKTPRAVIKRLYEEITRVLNRDDVKQTFLNTGSEVVAGSPEELTAEMKSDIAKWAKLIKEAGIKAD